MGERALKGRMRISQFHEGKKALYDGSLQFFFHFLFQIVVPIDISSLFCLFQELQVILSCKETHIVDLGDARGKNLYGTGKKVGFVIIAQSGIIGAVDLVYVKVIVCCRVIDTFYIAPYWKRYSLVFSISSSGNRSLTSTTPRPSCVSRVVY